MCFPTFSIQVRFVCAKLEHRRFREFPLSLRRARASRKRSIASLSPNTHSVAPSNTVSVCCQFFESWTRRVLGSLIPTARKCTTFKWEVFQKLGERVIPRRSIEVQAQVSRFVRTLRSQVPVQFASSRTTPEIGLYLLISERSRMVFFPRPAQKGNARVEV